MSNVRIVVRGLNSVFSLIDRCTSVDPRALLFAELVGTSMLLRLRGLHRSGALLINRVQCLNFNRNTRRRAASEEETHCVVHSLLYRQKDQPIVCIN